MFKKVRNRILLLNMVMVSAVVIIAFAVIFAITYTREQNANREKLLHASLPQMTVSGHAFAQAERIRAVPGENAFFVSQFATRISPDAGLSFSLLVDSQVNVVEINSMVDLPDTAYTQAASGAMKKPEGDTVITLEGRTWQYMISPVTLVFRESSNASVTVSGEFNNIRFLDITDSQRMIQSLAFMLLGLTLVILAAFFFISRFFANRAIRPMEEAWEKQGRFIADASHELKTPLSVIHANCGVLYAEREETVDSQIKWVHSILRAADRMAGLASGLLSLTRMEDTQSELQNLSFDLSVTAADTVTEMEAAALAKGLRIHRRIEPDIAIESDRRHIRQVLSILLDNAVKYTLNGGEITVSLTREKRHVLCTVRNSGGGIPSEDLPRLFDRFYRGDPARSSENGGYGLGLAIAKAAAERLDAQLSVNSKSGEYTEFSLLLKTKLPSRSH